jgi:hypothetical protein
MALTDTVAAEFQCILKLRSPDSEERLLLAEPRLVGSGIAEKISSAADSRLLPGCVCCRPKCRRGRLERLLHGWRHQ